MSSNIVKLETALQAKIKNNAKKPREKQGQKPDAQTNEVLFSDNYDAIILAEKWKNSACYDAIAKQWYFYETGRWLKDDKMQRLQLAIEVLVKHYSLILNRLSRNEFNDAIKRLKIIKSTKGIEQILKQTSALLAVVTNEFEAKPWLYNMDNGTLNLDTIKLEPHSPDNLCWFKSGFIYDTSAKCPNWEKFISDIAEGQNDKISWIKYLKKWCGYLLTGNTDYQMWLFAFGSGRNGKGTLFNTLRMLENGIDAFGNINNAGYYYEIPIELLYKNSFQSKDYGLASIRGARFIRANEAEKGKKLNASLIKQLTGQDVLAVRKIYQEPENIVPWAKMVIVGNEKPLIDDNSDAFWRRIKPLEFKAEFNAEDNNFIHESVLMNRFKNELSGILNWCIDGLNLIKTEGFNDIECVKRAINDYKAESDILLDFLENTDTYIINKKTPENKMYIRELYEDFCRWEIQELCIKSNTFGSTRPFINALKARGFFIKPGAGGKKEILGIRKK